MYITLKSGKYNEELTGQKLFGDATNIPMLFKIYFR
jgi:hypothetical protein